MLRWLPNALYNAPTERQHFLKDIFVLVFGVHVLCALMMVGFSAFDHKQERYAISLSQQGATYVLMPLHKKVDQSQQKKKRHASASQKKSQIMNYQDYQRKKHAKKNLSSKPAAKIAVSAVATAQKRGKPAASKPRASTALMEEKKSKNTSKKTSPKHNQKTQIISAPVAHASSIQEPQGIPTQQLPVVQQEPVQEKQSLDVPEQKPAPVDESTETRDMDDQFDADNVIFVGYEQLDECVVSSKIQQSIQQCWTPPVGVAPETTCQMRVTISAQGAATDVMLEQGSGIVVYDISARQALRQVIYPKEVWNKTITIVLGN